MSLHHDWRTVLAAIGLASTMACSSSFTSQLPDNLMASSMGSPSRAANGTLKLFVMPDAGVAPVLAAIDGAQKSIDLEMYILTYHGATQQIVDAMLAKQKNGVKVRVMVEPAPYIPTDPGMPPPTPINKAAVKALIAGGVQVKWASPKFNYTHEKAMIIDGKSALIMSLNFSDTAFTKNRDYFVVDSDPVDVAGVRKVFEADWNATAYVPTAQDLVVSPDNSRAKLASLLSSAQQSVVMQSEFFSDPEMAKVLGDKVRKNGVAVRVMLSKQSPNPKTGDDINKQEKELLAGVGITDVKFVVAPLMHAKAIVVDHQRGFIGSENFSANSLDNNREMGVLFRDPAIIQPLEQVMEKDWSGN